MSINTVFASAINTLAKDLTHFKAIRKVRSERTMVINTALKLVNMRYATFDSLGFDQDFLQNEATDLIEPFVYGGAVPKPETLASVWATHFRFGNKSQHALAQSVLPMMNDFIYLLETSVDETTDLDRLVESTTIHNLVLQSH